jgi:hypothetical protein
MSVAHFLYPDLRSIAASVDSMTVAGVVRGFKTTRSCVCVMRAGWGMVMTSISTNLVTLSNQPVGLLFKIGLGL